ncbi:hypothetical protein [Bradyrhizobium elkanii]
MLPQIGRISAATSHRHEDQPMTMRSPDITGFRFSTADFGERDRLPIFREQIGRMIVKLDPEPLSAGAFHAEANVRELPGLGIGSWACSNLTCWRSTSGSLTTATCSRRPSCAAPSSGIWSISGR